MSDELEELLERVEALEKQLDLIVDFLELLGEAENENAARDFRRIEEQNALEEFLKRTQNPDKPIGDT